MEETLELDTSARNSIKRMPKGALVSCGSRCISLAERNYAMVEFELLALQWATEKARLNLLRTTFTAITDHQPLVPLVNGKNYDAHSNARIQRILEKLLGFEMTLFWTQGNAKIVADAFSRAPVWLALEPNDILAYTAHVPAACEKHINEAISALSTKAKQDQNYKAIHLLGPSG